MTPTEIRLRLLENGYTQLTAVRGKIPLYPEWQKHQTTPDMLRKWERDLPHHQSTGLVCDDVIGIDLDLLHREAAEAADEVVREWFPGAHLLVRFGREPKRLFMFRTAQVFPRFVVTFFAPESAGLENPNGRIKGGPCMGFRPGSQFVAFGIHEDTKEPYRWPDKSPLEVRAEDLPEITETGARELAAYLAEMLKKRLAINLQAAMLARTKNWISRRRRHKKNGSIKLNMAAQFGINQAILELPMTRHDEGLPCEEVIKELYELVQCAHAKYRMIIRTRRNRTGIGSANRSRRVFMAISTNAGARIPA